MLWNSKPKVEKLFGSWPSTEIKKDKVIIRPDFFTPKKMETADNVANFLAFLGTGGGCILAIDSGANPLIGLIVGAILGLGVGKSLRNNFKTTISIIFTPEFIRIPSGWRSKNYDLKIPHGFNMELHEKAQNEAEAEEDERYKIGVEKAKKGKNPETIHRKKKYYRDSYQVFFEYFGERIYLAEIYEKSKAQAFMLRLQAVDQYVKALEQSSVENSGIAEASQNPGEKTSPYGERPALGE